MRQGADALLVENPNLLNVLATLTAPSLRLDCFPIGVDGSVFHPGYEDKSAAWRFVLDIPPDATVLLSPRGWSQLYGQHHIMRAFALAFTNSTARLCWCSWAWGGKETLKYMRKKYSIWALA